MTRKKGKKTPAEVKKAMDNQPPPSTQKRVTQAKSAPSKKKKITEQYKPTAANTTQQFPIVGIGASAGGLEAFEAFFKEMPENSGIAFVLVAHLDPSHASILPDIIQKKTRMKVSQVTDNMKVEADQVYIIPPNKEMIIVNRSLQLQGLSRPRGVNLPIDTFFRSLAQDQTSNTVGIILSGTGTDGTLGLRAIKGEAGMVMVQDMASAKYDGMPRSAIATGLADFVLAPSMMPSQLLNYVRHLSQKPAGKITVEDDIILSVLQKIFILLRARTEHDFSLYKKNTICRRIERRMHVHQIDNIDNYVRYLQDSEREVGILFKELLIGVTNFFRDPEAFDLLRDKYLPDLLKNKPDDYSIRIWVPGCSSGEEVYSIAIIVQEYMDALGRHFNIQIFGTDIDEDAVNIARSGIYPEAISADVSPERLKKFFAKEDDQFLIKKSIREMVVFAPQNIIKDPPFTKLDLLCCRNLLIYFGPELQKKLLPIFHYSLKQDSLLFLGSSETIGQFNDLFEIQEKKWKIFKRNPSESATHPGLEFPSPLPVLPVPVKETSKTFKKAKVVDTLQLLKTILSQSDLPASVIIDDQANIIYIHGRTGRFLEPPEGETSINILEMARPGLKAGLTSAIHRMTTDRQEVYSKNLQVKDNGGYVNINLTIRPLPDLQTGLRGLMMVVFEETEPLGTMAAQQPSKPRGKKKSEEVSRLEDELQYTKENLQTTIEELETSNEELKSTNEELQSTNEELQSTNEELETSKEELQSLNEESATVNAELQSRIDELSKANNDMKNLLTATQIATLFLDTDLNISRFTPKATDIVPLAKSDLGRPIGHFVNRLKDVNLQDFAKQVLDDLRPIDIEVDSMDGNYFRMRVMPYRTTTNMIDGVVITFDNITSLKDIENQLLRDQQIRRLAAVVKDSNDAITLQDFDGNILAWNKGAEKMYGYSEVEALKMNIRDIVPDGEKNDAKRMITTLEKEEVDSLETQRLTKDGKIVNVWLTITKLIDKDGRLEGVATTERDISRYKQMEKSLAEED